MWHPKEEEEKQRQLEKLIDWELSKQLTWALVFLTATLGLIALLASSLLKQWIDFSGFPLISINLAKTPFVIVFFLFLVFGVDLSFYRLATSLVRLRNWTEMLTSELARQELKEKVVLRGICELFVQRIDKNRFSLRTWLIGLLILFGDLLLIWALVSLR